MDPNRPRRLQIIFAEGSEGTAEHAKTLLQAIEKEELRAPGRYSRPRGVAYHTAVFPVICGDCGLTFWARDEYSTHIGCKGVPPKQQAGFGDT